MIDSGYVANCSKLGNHTPLSYQGVYVMPTVTLCQLVNPPFLPQNHMRNPNRAYNDFNHNFCRP